MKRRLFYGLAIFFCFIFLNNDSVAGIQDSDEYEGWVWRKSLNFLIPDTNAFVNADAIHQELFDLAEKLQAVKGKQGAGKHKAKKSENKERQNIALLRLGLILEDANKNKTYTPVSCFDDYAFYSGQETHKLSSADAETLDKIIKTETPFFRHCVIDEPKKYSFSLKDIIEDQKRFFSKESESETYIGIKKYQSQDLESKIEAAKHVGSLDDTFRAVSGSIESFVGRHSDSEKKVCFFLEDSLKELPFYWDMKIISLLKRVVPMLEEFYIQKYNNENVILEEYLKAEIDKETKALVSLPSLDDSFAEQIAKISKLKNKLTSLKKVAAPPQAMKREPPASKLAQKEPSLLQATTDEKRALPIQNLQIEQHEPSTAQKKEASKKVSVIKPIKAIQKKEESRQSTSYDENFLQGNEDFIKLNHILNRVVTLRERDPLKVGLETLEKDEGDCHLAYIGRLLSLQAETSWKTDIDYLQNTLLSAEEGYNTWLRYFGSFLEKIPESMSVNGIVLHLYSRRDICDSCAVRLSRECEYPRGFVAKFRSILSVNIDAPSFFRLLTSCGELRYKERKKHVDQFSEAPNYLVPIMPSTGETPEEKKAIFFQKLIQFPNAD